MTHKPRPKKAAPKKTDVKESFKRAAKKAAHLSEWTAPHSWRESVDPASGDTYYSNTVTGETTWDKPKTADDPAASVL